MSLLQESFVGQVLNFASGHRLFTYEEERSGWEAPAKYRRSGSPSSGSSATLVDPETRTFAQEKGGKTVRKQGQDGTNDGQKGEKGQKTKAEEGDDANVVSWHGDDDPANPMNWSFSKKCFVTGEICLLTISIYAGSSIYSPGVMSVMEEFEVSEPVAILGLSTFVAGYGLSPMIFGPLSEIPQLGRTAIYILTLFVFVCVQVPTAVCQNIGSLLSLRFIAGFFGGTVLGTGGASIGDMWSQDVRAIPIAVWGLSAVCGPTVGPSMSAFAVQANGWRWAIWELLWLSGFGCLFLAFFLPETSAANILARRARRMRRATGNKELKSKGELDSESMTPRAIAFEALARPFILLFLEPIVLASNIYIGLAYALLYCWLESFPIVFVDIYGFNLGQESLAFLGILVAVLVTFVFICWWTLRVYKPALEREGENLKPEIRMHLAMIGAFFIPVSLFWYGWSARESIHWIMPIIGAALFGPGIFLLFQSILNYLGDTYTRYAASAFAGNDLVRSLFGAAFPPFATAMYLNLGVGWASSLLGFLSIVFVPIPFVLYFFGERIRKFSRYADSGQPT